MWLEILVANLATNFQDLVAKVKNLVALAPVLGTILRPGFASYSPCFQLWYLKIAIESSSYFICGKLYLLWLIGNVTLCHLIQCVIILVINVPVNSKTAHPPPPRQSLGIWRLLSSVQRGIWPKMRPARWGIWLFMSKRLSAVENKRTSQILWFSTWAAFTGHCSCLFHVVFLLLSFYIVMSWNMPLFKV